MDPFRNGAAGVVSSAKLFRPEDCAGLTTPAAPLQWLRGILLMAQPPSSARRGIFACPVAPLLLWRCAPLDRSAPSRRGALRPGPTCPRRTAGAAPAASRQAGFRQPVEVIRPIANRTPRCVQKLR